MIKSAFLESLLSSVSLPIREMQQTLILVTPAGRQRFAEARKAFKDLMYAFYVEGGVTLTTRASGDSNAPLAAKTVIQPDGDFLAFVTPQCLNRKALWERHNTELREKLEHLENQVTLLKGTFYGMVNLISVGIFAVGLDRIPQTVSIWSKVLLGLLAIVVLNLALRWLLVRLGSSLVRRRLNFSL